MSSAVLFLLGAMGVASAGSVVLWYMSGRAQSREPDYQEQMRAIAPRTGHGPVEQPSGIVPLDGPYDEES